MGSSHSPGQEPRPKYDPGLSRCLLSRINAVHWVYKKTAEVDRRDMNSVSLHTEQSKATIVTFHQTAFRSLNSSYNPPHVFLPELSIPSTCFANTSSSTCSMPAQDLGHGPDNGSGHVPDASSSLPIDRWTKQKPIDEPWTPDSHMAGAKDPTKRKKPNL